MSYTTTFFSGVDSSGNTGLWRTNGTAKGTVEIAKLYGASNAPYGDFTLVGAHVLFEGRGPGGATGLWSTDGSATGTVQVLPVSASREFNSVADIASLGTKAVFNALDSKGNYALWVTHGTDSSTVEIAKTAGIDPRGMTSYKSKVYFGAFTGGGLWSTTGTSGGTVELAGTTNLTPEELTVCNGKLYFIDEKTGNLWVSDGTAKGTHAILGLGHVLDLTAVGKELYFDFEAHNDGNYDLFRTDGTKHGTVELAANVFNNLNNPNSGPLSPDLTVYKGKVYFEGDSAIDTYATSIWVSNGTVDGTHEIMPIKNAATYGVIPTPDDPDYNGPGFAVIDQKLVFDGAAPGGYAPQWGETGLWVTNGTASTTHEITGIKNAGYPGVLGFVPSNMTTITLPSAPTAAAVDLRSTVMGETAQSFNVFARLGQETFAFTAGSGRERIYDASVSNDTFDLGGLGSSLSELRFFARSGGADTVIKGPYGETGDALVLKGITAADAQAHMHFVF